MSNIFHLAIPAGSLKKSIPFYSDILGCKLGENEEGKWQDINFWGNELTLHETEPKIEKGPERERHQVEMGKVCIPHFGIHLDWDNYLKVKDNVKKQLDSSISHLQDLKISQLNKKHFLLKIQTLMLLK